MVFAMCHFKYLVGAAMALAGLPAWQGFLCCTLGACSGTCCWVFAGRQLSTMWKTRFAHKNRLRINKRTRFLVRVRQRGGLWGVAFLSPVILSLPVGCLLALTFARRRVDVLLTHFVSILFWGGVFFGGVRGAVWG